MRASTCIAWLGAAALSVFAAGCQVTFQEGQFTCSTNAECPPGFGACVAGRCMIPDAWVELPDAWRADAWSASDAADGDADVDAATDLDAELDASASDADLDAETGDASDDAQASDAGADPVDAGTAP